MSTGSQFLGQNAARSSYAGTLQNKRNPSSLLARPKITTNHTETAASHIKGASTSFSHMTKNIPEEGKSIGGALGTGLMGLSAGVEMYAALGGGGAAVAGTAGGAAVAGTAGGAAGGAALFGIPGIGWAVGGIAALGYLFS